MKHLVWQLGCAVLVLSACDDMTALNIGQQPTQVLANVPEGVAALAAPNQDLSTVQIDPVDGCYVCRHVGPVETTMLPLRAQNGRPICTQQYTELSQPTET